MMAPTVCKVSTCEGAVEALNLCDKHYRRFRTHGTTELPPKPTVTERFNAKVNKTDSCWEWTGAIGGGGYGSFRVGDVTVRAHRFAYESMHGKIPDGLVLDHLCRNRACVRPSHLEAVEHRENTMRGETKAAAYAARDSCKHGHPLTADNIYASYLPARVCVTCARIRARERDARIRKNVRSAA